jgi:hypothetical protein
VARRSGRRSIDACGSGSERVVEQGGALAAATAAERGLHGEHQRRVSPCSIRRSTKPREASPRRCSGQDDSATLMTRDRVRIGSDDAWRRGGNGEPEGGPCRSGEPSRPAVASLAFGAWSASSADRGQRAADRAWRIALQTSECNALGGVFERCPRRAEAPLATRGPTAPRHGDNVVFRACVRPPSATLWAADIRRRCSGTPRSSDRNPGRPPAPDLPAGVLS